MSASLIHVGIQKIAAWSPGIETEDAECTWSATPKPLQDGDAPAVRFLPAMLRRRCNRLSRMMFEVAYRCCTEEEAEKVRCVFASRYGSIVETIALLECLAMEQPLSPTRFSHSVHNVQAGLFSVGSRNRQPATALSAGKESFVTGFLDAIAMLHRCGGPVLFVMGDEMLPEVLSPFTEPNEAPYALGILLQPAGTEGSESVHFGFSAEPGHLSNFPWPDAFEFLRWWHREEPRLEIGHGTRSWVFERKR